ncbi:MAG: hypothetical protein N4A71_22200 [Carboxylicivirga sp.]|jgi:uridine kinase|nr:hypothetical protein [Carboxylicivirga sp.]MCT4645809.1 hypothetical protein [Carboxylicivirga sp.]
MSTIENYDPKEIAKMVVNSIKSSGKKFLFISGNGGSGKTELCKIISEEASKFGHINFLDMDDFVVDTKLRNSASISWTDINLGEQTGRYTTSFAASYFLQNIKAIMCNIENGNNYYHWPKKAKENKECRLLYGDAFLTIIEGTGTVFLNKKKEISINIFMKCSKEIEIARRIKRGKFSNEKNAEEVRKKFAERNSQYKANIEPFANEYEIELESLEDFSLNVVRDDDNCLI